MKAITKTKLGLYIGVIFVAGVVSGSVTTLRKTRAKAEPPSLENVCNHLQKELKAKLNLTDDQFEKIRPILNQTFQEIHGIHSRTMHDIDAAICKSHQEMGKYLTEEQRKKLEAMDAERRERSDRHGKRRPAPGC